MLTRLKQVGCGGWKNLSPDVSGERSRQQLSPKWLNKDQHYTPETKSLSSKVQQQSKGKSKPWDQNISKASKVSKKAYLMWVEREADSNWLLLLHPIQKKFYKILGALVRSQKQFQPTKWSDKGPSTWAKEEKSGRATDFHHFEWHCMPFSQMILWCPKLELNKLVCI